MKIYQWMFRQTCMTASEGVAAVTTINPQILNGKMIKWSSTG